MNKNEDGNLYRVTLVFKDKDEAHKICRTSMCYEAMIEESGDTKPWVLSEIPHETMSKTTRKILINIAIVLMIAFCFLVIFSIIYVLLPWAK